MRKLWLILIMTTLGCSSFAQNSVEEDFNALLSHCRQEQKIDFTKKCWARNISSEGYILGDRIHTELAVKYLGLTYTEYPPIVYTGTVMFQNERFIALSYNIVCGAGGICEERRLVTVRHDGEFIDSIRLSSTFGDIEGTLKTRNVYLSDSLVIRTYYEIRHISDRPRLDVLMRVKQTVFSVSDDGRFNEIATISINPMREYYWLSTSLIQDRTLDGRSADELALMRNEIYASHGYIFDSRRWSRYFSEQLWYEPEKLDVSGDLTWIEARNLDMIMNRERRQQETFTEH